ncbi:MAG: LacI family transcriptional regulator [Ruminiclostridium sp.]|nr:LacI family transcriptional regulator [Ruminiclostridium sp.]
MANIKNVAKAAGVSVSTVSRIINNSSLISADTRDKVLKVMKEMNYVPNIMARGLSNQQAFTVALLVNIDDRKSFDNPFFYEMMHGIETIVYKRGLCLIIANLNTSQNKDDMLNRLIHEKRTQGVMLPSSIINPQLVKNLKGIRFPFVSIGEPEGIKEPIDWVDINNFQGGRQAVDHLLAKGYRDIAFIGGSQRELFNKNRLLGYKAALAESGINYRQEYVQEGSNTKSNGVEMMQKLLSLATRPDAVICGDNILCMGAMKAIKDARLLIPDDIGVLSFDNFPVAELLEPPLTTIDIDVFELGVQTANILFKLIDNPAARQQQSLISTCIVARESTMREFTS